MGAFFLGRVYSEQDINTSDPGDRRTETTHAAIIATGWVNKLGVMEYRVKVVAEATVIVETLSISEQESSASPYTSSGL